jgi:hypothetical protein
MDNPTTPVPTPTASPGHTGIPTSLPAPVRAPVRAPVPVPRPVPAVARAVGDAGMATAEYAVATLAAVGFAGLLFAVLRSGEVQEMLAELVRRALGTV